VNLQTEKEYMAVIAKCKALFDLKNKDYGASWRIMRLPSITDQIYIKANRIRTLQEKGIAMVADDENGEFVGIINYCVIALIQAELQTITDENEQLNLSELYNKKIAAAWQLLSMKNHDYDEAWRSMRVSSITDIILMKIFRLKQIEDNAGLTLVSEGVEANYMDILNYAVFALILKGFHQS
jgi:Ser-tRNA(Ala) deacylase AlaX